MTDKRLTFNAAKDELKAAGVILTMAPGEYHLSYRYGRGKTVYITEELPDALAKGLEIAPFGPPAPEMPLGPLGRGNTRRAAIVRHNREIARQRRNRAVGKPIDRPRPKKARKPKPKL